MTRTNLPSAIRSTFRSSPLSAILLLSGALGVASLVGCSESTTDGCAPGTMSCECDANSMCVTGLVCDAGMCVAGTATGGAVGSGGAATGGAVGSGGAATGGAVGSGGVATGGAASGGAASGGAGAGGTPSGDGGAATGGGDGAGGSTSGPFTLTSPELTEGATIATANTCDGGGSSGPSGPAFGEAIAIEWSGAPEGTMSFALTMIDTTLVDGAAMNYLGCHSYFYNLPATTSSLATGSWVSELDAAGAEVHNNGYLGPCPDPGNTDTYVLTLYAMPTETVSPTGNFNSLDACNMFRSSLEDEALGMATLSGTYMRQ